MYPNDMSMLNGFFQGLVVEPRFDRVGSGCFQAVSNPYLRACSAHLTAHSSPVIDPTKVHKYEEQTTTERSGRFIASSYREIAILKTQKSRSNRNSTAALISCQDIQTRPRHDFSTLRKMDLTEQWISTSAKDPVANQSGKIKAGHHNKTRTTTTLENDTTLLLSTRILG